MYEDFSARKITEIKEKLRTSPFIKNWHLDIRRSTGMFSTKDKLHIRLWVNKALMDAQDVTNTLADQDTFEKSIKRLAAEINLNVEFDIYDS